MSKSRLCHFLPLRLFMALDTLQAAYLTYTINPWKLGGSRVNDSVELWAVMLTLAGIWMTVTALLEFWIGAEMKGFGKMIHRSTLRVVTKASVFGYFLCGAVWGSIGYHTWLDDTYQSADVTASMFMGFLLFLAFKDACTKRERAVTKYEARKTAALLLDDVGSPPRVRS